MAFTVAQVGFPIAVAGFLLLRVEKVLQKMVSQLTQLTLELVRLNGFLNGKRDA